MPDNSNGYDAIADEFIARRTRSGTGASRVREWAKALPPGAAVLDLGCGSGVPVSQALVASGLSVYGVDASLRMIAAFRARFPAAEAECCAAEDSQFFARTFDGVVAWGLMFLLTPEAQALLIRKVARALNRGGRLLFTSPPEACEWLDAMTARTSISLGAEMYQRLLDAECLALLEQYDDEGQNHYYSALKA